MERDPLLLAWRTSRAGHVFVVLVSLLALPVALFVLDLPRQATLNWQAFTTGEPLLDLWQVPGFAGAAAFLRQFVGPFELPALVFHGAGAVLFVLGALILRTLFFAIVDLWRSASAAKAVAQRAERLGRRLADLSAVQEADTGELLPRAGDALVRLEPAVAGAITGPVFALSRLCLGILYGLLVDLRLGLAVLAASILFSFAADRRLRQRERVQTAASLRRRSLAAASRELVRRWPLLRAHGTADVEARAFGGRLAVPDVPPLAGIEERLPGILCDVVVLAAPLLAFAVTVEGGGGAGLAVAALFAFVVTMGPARFIGEWGAMRDAAAIDAGIVADAFAALATRGDDGASPRVMTAGASASSAQFGFTDLVAGSGMEVPLNASLAAGEHLGILASDAPAADRLAAVIAGLRAPAGGAVLLGGADITRLPTTERARRLGHAAAQPVLIPGSLGDNLAYGLSPAEREALREADWAVALDASGLRPEVEARALGASVDPSRRPGLAERILAARAAVARNLEASDLDGLVARFEPDRFNRYATIGENLLFGVPVGETFDVKHLPAHPFTRAVLEAQDLTRPLVQMGYAIAEALLDLFAEIPDGHPLFARFSFFAAADRGAVAEIVARKGPRRRGPGAATDRMRLLDLAFRYVETRHRLGLVDEALEVQIVAARKSFRELLPANLRRVVDFYDPAEVCPSASFADNLLFGRIAFDLAGAETKVGAIVRDVITREGLTGDMMRLGLGTRVAVDDGRLMQPGVDIVRCLLRHVDVLVAARPTAGLAEGEGRHRMAMLSQAMAGRILVVVAEDEAVEVLGRVLPLSPSPEAESGLRRNLA